MPHASRHDRPSTGQPFGSLVLDSIRRTVERTLELGKRLPLPGEGSERPFRSWLISDVLVTVLGWPREKVIEGERFDVLLLDEAGNPVANVETKAPLHQASQEERAVFEERLRHYPTLRTAYLTNGPEWERLDLLAPQGVLTIRSRSKLEVSEASPEEAEAFFAPLRGDRYFHWGRRNRSRVTRAQPHILEMLARDFDTAVGEMADGFVECFARYEGGGAGVSVQSTTRSIFDDWCRRSLQASPSQVVEALAPLLQADPVERNAVAGALRELGFTPRAAEAGADQALGLLAAKRRDDQEVRSTLTPLFHEAVKKLCAQSAHLLLARTLVYRVGEDMGLFSSLLGGEAMESALAKGKDTVAEEPTPALASLDTARRRMTSVLPLVYQLSDLDWWRVPEEKRVALAPAEKALVESVETRLNLSVARMLRTLDGYHFGSVDADVWRNVYQYYLPADERQRLGGFYTPEELVELVLDQAGYVPEAEGLCQRTVLDPACGSGAFVALAAARLLDHLSRPLPCHHGQRAKRSPAWERQRSILETVLKDINAVDIHPFAAFLTTLNLTFLLLPGYATVRKHIPTFPLELRVFVGDSLEKPEEQALTRHMFEQLNSRIQLTAESYERYRALVNARFDYVFGNPPWGGALKGPLAPVFDEDKKRRFRREYPHAARGKYDVYGLFMERALQVLKPGGRLALVTQGSYLDKEWARGLRQLIATKAEVQAIIDLNPFGQVLFNAMNIPAITIADNREPGDGRFLALLSRPAKFTELTQGERRRYVIHTVRGCLEQLTGRRRTATVDFATAARLPRALLRETADKRWDLSPKTPASEFKAGWLKVTDILEPRQGVTPGGCLDIFLMPQERALALGLEQELVHRAMKTRETERWHPRWQGRMLLYPYIVDGEGAHPAFALRGGILGDALNFEVPVDDRERDLRRGRPLDSATLKDILEHRIALGLVRFPQVARYLVQHYARLEGRIFEKRRFSELGKLWYEYHRPRDPRLLLGAQRIVSPRLAKAVRFALDAEGFLADDACQYLLPTDRTAKGREELRGTLSSVLGREATLLDLLRYCLAFLNSPYAQATWVAGRRPRPGEVHQVTEEFLSEIPVVPPSTGEEAEDILGHVERLTRGPAPGEKAVLEAKLFHKVMGLLK